MGGVFSNNKTTNNNNKNTKKKKKMSDQDKAILDLKHSRDRLKKYQIKLEKDAILLTEQARQYIKNNNKKKALIILKLKRYKKEAMEKIDNELYSTLQMIEDIEWESAQVQVLKSLELGNKQIERIHSLYSVEDVERIMEETEEAKEFEDEVNIIITGGSDILWTEEDNDAVLKELEEMELEDDDVIHVTDNLPYAPSDTINIQSTNTNKNEEEKIQIKEEEEEEEEEPVLA